MDVLIFELGAQRYALPVAQTIEIVRATSIVALPQAPDIVEGVIDMRGTIVPVLDIRARFRLEAKPLSISDQLVIAQAGARRVAIRTDRTVQLVQVAASELRSTEHVAGHQDYVAGIAALSDGMVLIHDLETFLSESEGATLDHSLAEMHRE